jgi:ABC-type Zn2+ transport system substrate-binding protein/surface adhesin
MIGAAVLAAVGTTQIAVAGPNPEEFLQARSFAELLQPIPDATVLLAAAEASSARDLADSESMDRRMVAQYYHHHHHHHHHHYRRYHHHHHHHHYRRDYY